MKRIVITGALMLVLSSPVYADNLIYMDQTGSNASININRTVLETV